VPDFRRLKVLFHDMGSDSKAKSYDVNGAVVAYAVLDAPPVDPTVLTRTALTTRTPHILEFTEEERGKTVYVAICWQNEKGEKGLWSEIESAIVPQTLPNITLKGGKKYGLRPFALTSTRSVFPEDDFCCIFASNKIARK
jgi:hypothetical protein